MERGAEDRGAGGRNRGGGLNQVNGPSAALFGVWICAVTVLLTGLVAPARAEDYALTVYAGRATSEKWFESVSPSADFVDSYIVVGALAWVAARLVDGALTIEIEGQVAKHFGDQDHLEFNLPVAGRWQRFPWDETVDTSFAFGIGPSWATEEPEVEAELNDSTDQFLVHWFAEIALGPPGASWAAVLRLHHRSDAFGLVAEDGGLNTVAVGVKYRF